MKEVQDDPALGATLLEVFFDADQASYDLDYRLQSPIRGRRADSMYFSPGEQLRISVVGAGSQVDKSTAFESFQVIDCVIVTRPQAVQRAPAVPAGVWRLPAAGPGLQHRV
jgi:hypothetical protein